MGSRRCAACGSNEINTSVGTPFCAICGRSVLTETVDDFQGDQLTKSLEQTARDLTSNRPTRALHPREITEPSWPLAIAALEQLKGSGETDYIEAFRLGLLALLTIATREITAHGTTPERIIKLRKLTDALAKLPMDYVTPPRTSTKG